MKSTESRDCWLLEVTLSIYKIHYLPFCAHTIFYCCRNRLNHIPFVSLHLHIQNDVLYFHYIFINIMYKQFVETSLKSVNVFLYINASAYKRKSLVISLNFLFIMHVLRWVISKYTNLQTPLNEISRDFAQHVLNTPRSVIIHHFNFMYKMLPHKRRSIQFTTHRLFITMAIDTSTFE